ncbi:probable cytochrome P450 6a14 [Drosophila biarmipes]|uniref:probable cytochrome P450 6a14 n=1 Tax=Drosophila biarmipes TaxID=125945 RepID=UPI001CDB21F7|nr:probable cytochrome P450 6a14 [Drosophila biarmipes]
MFMFVKRTALIIDLDLIKQVLIKDFNYFQDRGAFNNPRDDPLTGHLFSLEGDEWRAMRHKLTPVFTSGKIKHMSGVVVEVGHRLFDAMDKAVTVSRVEDGDVEIKDLCARFTTDVIGSCAFGLECNSLQDPNAEFRAMGRKHFESRRHPQIVHSFIMTNAKLAKKLRVKMLPDDITDFFMSAVRNTVFVAGFETSSSTMSFCLYELALNQDIQQRVRQKIDSVLSSTEGGEITYDALAEMTYLEQVLAETLRKYSIVSHLVREANRDYKVPGTDIVIDKGSNILIPVYNIHHDPDIYSQPEKFDPSRFDPEAVKSRHPMAYLPFGDGPRNCIGLRFGKIQAKIGLVSLLRHFKFAA